MGTPKAVRDDEAPRMADQVHHYVRLTHPFYMALTETNQEQFAAVMGANPSWFSKGGGGAGKVKGKDTSKYPVEQVSWYDALMFCQKTKVQGLRIPTKAEWEYACRAGTQTNFALGQAITVKEANFNDELHRTARVASYRENNFGLFDMHGNVLEWCLDGYLIQYEKLPAIDPFNWKPGALHGRARRFVVRQRGRLSFRDPFQFLGRSPLQRRRFPRGVIAVESWQSRSNTSLHFGTGSFFARILAIGSRRSA